jgi:hypothetical protein
MRVKTVLILGVLFFGIAAVGLSSIYPQSDDMFVENPFWNGMSEVYRDVKPVRISSLRVLGDVVDPFNSTLLMLGPSTDYSDEDISAVRSYLEEGGTLALADDFGTGNQLLVGLEVKARFSGLLLEDTLFKERNDLLPRVLDLKSSEYTNGVSGLALNTPTVLVDIDEDQVLAYSSVVSFIGEGDKTPTAESIYGPFPVLALIRFGGGRLLLIADPSLFLNSMIDLEGNDSLLLGLARGSVIIDESHSVLSRLTQFKMLLAQLYSVLSLTEVKYGLAALMVVSVFKVKWGEPEIVEVDEVEAVMKRHPEYDRRLIEEVDRFRRRARGVQ